MGLPGLSTLLALEAANASELVRTGDPRQSEHLGAKTQRIYDSSARQGDIITTRPQALKSM